jgi:hypothetical protein
MGKPTGSLKAHGVARGHGKPARSIAAWGEELSSRNTFNTKVYRKLQESGSPIPETKYQWMSGASNLFAQGNWAKVLPVWWVLHRGRSNGASDCSHSPEHQHRYGAYHGQLGSEVPK